MSKKKIGIVGWKTGDNSFGITTAYMSYFQKYGTVQILPIWDDEIFENLDLVVLPGGLDVSPMRYGGYPALGTQKPDVIKEAFDQYLLPDYIEANVPIFGICRGHQTLAAHYNVPLVQEIGNSHPHSTKTRDEKVHDLHITSNFAKFMKINQKRVNKVNSLHHQAIHIDNLLESTEELIPIAVDSNSKKYVEIMIGINHPIASVQYHPEELWDDIFAHELISTLLKNRQPIFHQTQSILS